VSTCLISEFKELPQLCENWKREAYKRKELNDLCIIKPNMSKDEIQQRVKAVTFPNAPGAYIEIGGMKFNYDANNE
jgi:hypothetical protein